MLATREIYQIINQAKIRDIVADDTVKICRTCGEPDSSDYCLCTPEVREELRKLEEGL